jgi:glycosyl transferase family 4/glycosyl transferase family 1
MGCTTLARPPRSDTTSSWATAVLGRRSFSATYPAPIVNYFEYYYHARQSDMDFRPDFPPAEMDYLRARALNAMILLDLEACAAGYSPTRWQWSLLPTAWQPKVQAIHDGIDIDLWKRREVPRRNRRRDDWRRREDRHVRGPWARGHARIRYLRSPCQPHRRRDAECALRGRRCGSRALRQRPSAHQATELADIFALSDLHVYLTTPFILSWSVLNALACECVVLASDTAPVQEVLRHETNGLLAGFFDVEGLTTQALRVLRDPLAYRKLGVAGRSLVEETYSTDKTLPQLWALFERAMGIARPT